MNFNRQLIRLANQAKMKQSPSPPFLHSLVSTNLGSKCGYEHELGDQRLLIQANHHTSIGMIYYLFYEIGSFQIYMERIGH